MTTAQKIFPSFKAQAANKEETGVSKDDMFKIPIDSLLEEEGFNPRDYNDPEVEAQIEAFAKAYDAGQFVPPLVVRIDPSTGEFLIVEGHQRVRGAKRSRARGGDIERLTCVPFRGNNIDRHYVKHTSQNGLKFKPVAAGRDYISFLNMGQTVADIAKGVQKDVPYVESLILLGEATPDVHDFVNRGVVSATVAIDLLRKHGEKTGEILRAKYAEVKAKGKKKIMPADVQEQWIPPKKITAAIYSSLSPLYEVVAKQPDLMALLEQSEALGEEAFQGKTVTIDFASLFPLCQAIKDAEALKQKKTGQPASDSSASEGGTADPAEEGAS